MRNLREQDGFRLVDSATQQQDGSWFHGSMAVKVDANGREVFAIAADDRAAMDKWTALYA